MQQDDFDRPGERTPMPSKQRKKAPARKGEDLRKGPKGRSTEQPSRPNGSKRPRRAHDRGRGGILDDNRFALRGVDPPAKMADGSVDGAKGIT